MDTLRVVANALEVEVVELFEYVSSQEKLEEIEALSLEQRMQMTKRKAERNFFSLIIILFFFIMILLAIIIPNLNGFYQNVAGIIWVVTLLSGFVILKYLRYSWWEVHLIKKYPLTADINFDKHKNENKGLLWWKDDIARPIMLIFWGAILPIICIMKYALHIF